MVTSAAAAEVMAGQSPGEMKRFGLLTRAMRAAGSIPLLIPGGTTPP